MDSSARTALLAALRSAQNADGGWGYFPKKQSWLEPTTLAFMALESDTESRPAIEKAWSLIRSWQRPDGSFRTSASVDSPSWATSLVIHLFLRRAKSDPSMLRATQWLLSSKGTEGSWEERALNTVWKLPVEYDRRFKGWPWSPDASSWIEPTAHALLALKRVAARESVPGLADRIAEGEKMLLDRRTPDGGWNYGNRRVLKTDLPSYPETTGIALLGLQGATFDHPKALAVANSHLQQTRSRLAQGWLRIALSHYNQPLPPAPAPAPTNDILITALEALASAGKENPWLKI